MTRHEEEGRLDAAMQKADDLLVNSLKRDETMRKYRVIIGVLAVLVVGLMITVIVMMTSRPSSTRQVALAKGDPEVLTQEGWELWQQRKLREAEMKFDEATKADPKLANAWNGLGWARFNAGKTEPAMVAFTKCVELEPNHPAALNGLGQAYYAKNQFDKAEPFFVKAANNKATAAWWGLAKMYLLQGKFEEAEKWAKKLVDSGDTSAQPLLDAAKAKQLPDELRENITPVAAVSARAPRISKGIQDINRAYDLRQKGELKAAEKILQDVMARKPADKPDIETWVPTLFVAPLQLAEMWAKEGKLAEADALDQKVAEKAIELDKKYPNEKVWIPSYAAAAYMQRINILLAKQPPAIDAAKALAEEFKTRVPAYSGIMDYQQMTEAIAFANKAPVAAK